MRSKILLFITAITAPILLTLGIAIYLDKSEPPRIPTTSSTLGEVEVVIDGTSFWLPNIPFLSMLGHEGPKRAALYGLNAVARETYKFDNGEEFSRRPFTTPPPYDATGFIYSRGESWNKRTAFDALLDERSANQSLAFTGFLSIREPVRHDHEVSRPVFGDRQPTSIRGFETTWSSDENILEDDEILLFYAVSNEILFFDSPISIDCLGLRLSNDPNGINCRISGITPQGFRITVDIHIDETIDDAWPPLEDAWRDWPARFTALESVINSFMVPPSQ